MDLSEIKKLCDEVEEYCSKATPGPWLFAGNDCDDNDDDPYVYVELPETNGGVSLLFEADWGKTEDAEFIARARADLPKLVSALRERMEADRWIHVSNPPEKPAIRWRGVHVLAVIKMTRTVRELNYAEHDTDGNWYWFDGKWPYYDSDIECWRPLPSSPEVTK